MFSIMKFKEKVFSFNKFFMKILGIRVTTSRSLNFELSLSDGSYTLGTHNTAFLKSSDTFFRADKTIYSLRDGSLKLTSQQLSTGSDAHGDYDMVTNYYTAGNANVSTSFIIYQDVEVMVFNQVSENNSTGSGTWSLLKNKNPATLIGVCCCLSTNL